MRLQLIVSKDTCFGVTKRALHSFFMLQRFIIVDLETAPTNAIRAVFAGQNLYIIGDVLV